MYSSVFQLRWQNNDPLSYQAVSSYQINTTVTNCWTGFQNDDITLNTNLDHLLNNNHLNTNQTCAAVLLQNLAKPKWITVPCTERLIPDVICVIPRNNTNHSVYTDQRNHSFACDKNAILILHACIKLTWHTLNANEGTSLSNVIDISKKRSLIKLLGSIIQNFILHVFINNFENVITIKRFYNEQQITESPAKNGSAAFITYRGKREKVSLKRYLFNCGKRNYQLHSDLFQNYYGIESCKAYTSFYKLSTTVNQKCPILLHLSRDGHCLMYISLNSSSDQKHNDDLPIISTKNKQCSLKSFDYNCMLLKNRYDAYCLKNGLFPCANQTLKCYIFSDICKYRLNSFNHITPCMFGTHLYDCHYFECDMTFKCSGFYCIPWSYVL